MAHPVSINLFDLLDLADSLSRGTFLKVVVFIAAGIVIAFGVVLHERKRAKTRARAEQERLAGATVRELHLDKRDIHPPNRLERVLRDAMHADVHDVFEEDGRD